MQKITPFLWFDSNAEEAIYFYTSVFENSKILKVTRYDDASAKASGRPVDSVLTMSFQLEGQNFTALNGGPHFKLNPSISFFVYCESENKIDLLYKKLSEGGKILMPLDKYDWSKKYAWVQDKFGVSWQLDIDKINNGQKILPALLFANEQYAKVKDAVDYYKFIFPESKIILESPFPPTDDIPKDALLFAQFSLAGYLFNAMSGGKLKHEFDFNEAFSFVVSCKDQDEVDYYWNKLTADGGQESQCGWLKDKYGVSWQIVPTRLMELLNDSNSEKAKKAMTAMLQMKKIIISDLENSYKK